ncbi:polysaccharide biosynthesis/export family protein [Hymenobacter sp.]|uniref:polysaccharide biosynthesis/export family protein n=1 Tax=Hymenobacter sp. TaxID=1898978 RepID=UPI00286D6067|nr:polysaccharide biosynthesis/export family protein [Hymenobacter sp.]
MPSPVPICRLLLLLCGLLAGSCVSQRSLPYLQGAGYSQTRPVEEVNARAVYRIQVNDVLAIRVQSSQPEFNELFNATDNRALLSGDPSILYLTGYSVNEGGQISLPTVGSVPVAGLTVDQVQALVQQRVARFASGANVVVKLISFKLTVLGEVRNPGRYFVYNGQANVLEALGLAGDLNEFGNRQNVKLVRQTAKGSEVVLLDLTDPALLRSPYFYLLPNDALYVEPLKARTSRGNANNLGIVFAGLSTLVLLLGYIRLN